MGRRLLHPKSVTNIKGFKIPRTVKELNQLIVKSGISSIHDLDEGYLGSGSKVTQKQFVGLRVSCPRPISYRGIIDFQDEYGLKEVLVQAEELVENNSELRAYLSLISNQLSVSKVSFGQNLYPGFFAAVKYVQDQIKNVKGQNQPSDREVRLTTRTSSRKPLITLSNPFEKERDSHGADAEYHNDQREKARTEKTPNVALILLLQGISLFASDYI